MIVGSVDVTATLTIFARGFNPNFSPISLEPINTKLAPSTIPDELPGVCRD